MLKGFFVIIVIVVTLGVLFIIVANLLSWAGRCKECGSWKNWEDIRISYDDHQPEYVFKQTFSKCSKCNHIVWEGSPIMHKRKTLLDDKP